MTQIITIQIEVPDGVQVRVTNGPVVPPSDFEHEPLPTDTFADAQEFVGGAPVSPPPALVPATNGGVTPFRGAAMTYPGPTSAVWQVGAVHEQGHKPLKAGQRGGVFCPTKLGEDQSGKGIWCQFKA